MTDKTQVEQLLAAYKEFRRNVITPLSSQKPTRSLHEILKNNPDSSIELRYDAGSIWVDIGIESDDTYSTCHEAIPYDSLDMSDEQCLVLMLEEIIESTRKAVNE